MGIKRISDLFKVEASSPSEMATEGVVGFCIPDYQRGYSWSKDKIERLFKDCLIGFQRLSDDSDADAFTFLGTLILVEKQARAGNFRGKSIDIVDGQQRMTTLALLACALYEELNAARIELPKFDLGSKCEQWIREEIEGRLEDLLSCAAGSQKAGGKETFPYSMIVRPRDVRGRDTATARYDSPIGKFLYGFGEFADSEGSEFAIPDIGDDPDAKKIRNSYLVIKRLVKRINDAGWYNDTECVQVPISSMGIPRFKNLIDRLDGFILAEDDQDKAIEEIKSRVEMHGHIRNLLFAAYLCQRVAFIGITTYDKGVAVMLSGERVGTHG